MNAIADEQPDAPPPATPGQLRDIANMRFTIGVLERKSRSGDANFLWRIRLKVARHMYGVLARRARVSDAEVLPELSPDEQEELLRTHWMLQPEVPHPPYAARNVAWMRELEAKVSRFADRMRRRRADLWSEEER